MGISGGVGPHGVDEHADVSRELFLSPTGYTTGGVTSRGGYFVVYFVDSAVKTLWFNFKVPDDFVSFDSCKLVWDSAAASGNMNWGMGAYYAASGEAYNQHAESPGVGVTATAGANTLNVQEPANVLSLSSLASGDYVGVYVTRNASVVDDTLGQTVCIYGLLFTYTAEQ